jgi:integrase
MYYLDRLKLLDAENRNHLEGYIRYLKLSQLRDKTIYTKIWKLYSFFKWYEFRDTKYLTSTNIEDYIIYRRNSFSPVTVHQDILELKLYCRWLLPDRENELFKNIKQRRIKPNLPVDQLITRDDIQDLVNACTWPRDRALIMLMWDSGARISEITGLNIGHVQFDRYGAVIIVTGKTGRRRLRLISSVPDIQQWMNLHPGRDNANSPLFITLRNYSKNPRRLDMHTIENTLKLLAKKARINKRVYPHGIRHARLTDLARGNGSRPGLNEMELRLVAGWERNSAMPEVYVHLSGADVERKVLANAGIIEIETPQSEMKLEPIMCPRCKTMNAHYSTYCSHCSLVLTEKAAMSIEESVEVAKGSDDYQLLLNRLKSDLGLSHT